MDVYDSRLYLSEIFQEMGFGSRLSYRSDLEESNAPLVASIGHLCGAILGRVSETLLFF